MRQTNAWRRSTGAWMAVGVLLLMLSPYTLTTASDPTQATASLTLPPSQSIASSPAIDPTTTASSIASPDPSSSPDPPSPTATTDLSTASPSPTVPAPSLTPSVSPSPSPSFIPSVEASASSTIAAETVTLSPTSTLTSTHASPSTATPVAPRTILINEVAWAGTMASSSDEWIELFNPGPDAIALDGWVLEDGNDLVVSLSGSIPPFGYYLLERTDDSAVSDIPADRIYSGNLNNAGDTLWLRDSSGALIDSANLGGGGWPAGEAASRTSMERVGGQDIPGDWATWNGLGAMAHDAAGNLIHGTPRAANSMYYPTATSPALSPTGSPAPSGSPTPSPQPAGYPPGTILINEVAWMGTHASSSDEWIELMNTTDEAVDLSGWSLIDSSDLQVSLSGSIGPHGYYLLERSDDSTVSDVTADLIYGGTLSNSGECLQLFAPDGQLIDSANQDGGGWPAGNSTQRLSMERRGGEDRPGNWSTYTGFGGRAHDASGDAVAGTPREPNSIFFPTPSPTWVPGRIVINEVLIRPHYDWEGAGGGITSDEFIELYNSGPYAVNLEGWILDDVPEAGSRPYTLPGFTLPPNGYLVLFRSRTHLALNDGGDTVRLMAPNGMLIDKVRYLRVRAYNLSFGRLPNGSNQWQYGLWPTPGRPNLVFIDPATLPPPSVYDACPPAASARLLVVISGRYPAIEGWFGYGGHFVCPRWLPNAQPPRWGALSRVALQ